ncbi:MAG: S26 family signal peptidase [Victivallaceae bacterium]|nr:S26 family signal peptidase [Victivallaceae bacterium]
MLPTLRPGEGVMIDSGLDRRCLSIGDIIIYSIPGLGEKNIIHRIIRMEEEGYRTRGDNNGSADDYIVKFTMIRGKAMTVRRGTKTLLLAGGFRGRLRHEMLKTRKYGLIHWYKPLVWLSGMIDKSGVFHIFRRLIRYGVIRVKKGNGFEELLIRRQKLIGKKSVRGGRWKIKFPYKYFIDRKKLP